MTDGLHVSTHGTTAFTQQTRQPQYRRTSQEVVRLAAVVITSWKEGCCYLCEQQHGVRSNIEERRRHARETDSWRTLLRPTRTPRQADFWSCGTAAVTLRQRWF